MRRRRSAWGSGVSVQVKPLGALSGKGLALEDEVCAAAGPARVPAAARSNSSCCNMSPVLPRSKAGRVAGFFRRLWLVDTLGRQNVSLRRRLYARLQTLPTLQTAASSGMSE